MQTTHSHVFTDENMSNTILLTEQKNLLSFVLRKENCPGTGDKVVDDEECEDTGSEDEAMVQSGHVFF